MNVNAVCWTSFGEQVRHRSGATGEVVTRSALVEDYRSRVYVKAVVMQGDEFSLRDEPFRPVIGITYNRDVCKVTLGHAR